MRAFSKTLNAAIHQSGIYGAEWTLITLIHNYGPVSQTRLADELNIEPAAISKTLVKLEHKGFVERRYIVDHREKHVFLTPQAEQLYASLKQITCAHREQALSGLSPMQREALLHDLQQIHHNITK